MLIDDGNPSPTALAATVAVVTGAGQGIGRETVRILAHLGAAVVVAELKDSGRETERLIRAERGRAVFVRTDVADPGSMARLHEQTLSAFGEADILVNNACTFVVKPLLEQTVEEWDRVMAVNLRGAFLGLKLFLPGMLRRGSGVYVTMQSGEGMPYLAPYFASKVGLRSLALSLAAEVGEQSGVWSYCFGAGVVDTPGGNQGFRGMGERYGLSVEQFIQQSAPAGRPISTELSATGLVGTILHAQRFHGQETDYVAGLAQLGLDSWGEPISTESGVVLPERVAWDAPADDEQGRYVRVAAWRRSARMAEWIEKQQGMLRGWERDPQKLDLGLTTLRQRKAVADQLAEALRELLNEPACV